MSNRIKNSQKNLFCELHSTKFHLSSSIVSRTNEDLPAEWAKRLLLDHRRTPAYILASPFGWEKMVQVLTEAGDSDALNETQSQSDGSSAFLSKFRWVRLTWPERTHNLSTHTGYPSQPARRTFTWDAQTLNSRSCSLIPILFNLMGETTIETEAKTKHFGVFQEAGRRTPLRTASSPGLGLLPAEWEGLKTGPQTPWGRGPEQRGNTLGTTEHPMLSTDPHAWLSTSTQTHSSSSSVLQPQVTCPFLLLPTPTLSPLLWYIED